MENFSNPEDARTFLRERFLRMLGSLSGMQAQVCMQEKTNVTCKLGAADVDFQHIHVADMSTPMGVLPHATLRVSDIISIDVPQVLSSQCNN
ncbi:gem-associated protein 7 [Plakobranchus ocellatus]|uniref:Gem-associated protein 7 n=1 Tax=Plakobranchus ocellatus TaxID=259542 RepID=A0AAV3ZAD9_9GAST|nr:gem-associated protein 7 [Plakobranchus ocellatus]